jgi:hypothetical protein
MVQSEIERCGYVSVSDRDVGMFQYEIERCGYVSVSDREMWVCFSVR